MRRLIRVGERLKPLRRRKIKYPRVAKASVDQLALCTRCGNPMRLFGVGHFKCQCGQETTAEAVVEAFAPA